MSRKQMALITILMIALSQISSGRSTAGFISNGGFEQNTGAGQLGYANASGTMITATGWTSTGYNVLFASGTADTTGSYTQFGHNITLWGPNDGSANGLPATSPDGGYYLGSDGAYNVGPVSQSMTGLVVGQTYQVGFWWAGAQQNGYNGATSEAWKVSFGNTTLETSVVNNVNHGFTGWMYQTFNFVADNVNDTLSFLAVGTPSGEPPFSLLDGVSVNVVPEPSAIVLTGIGLIGLVGFSLRKRRLSAN